MSEETERNLKAWESEDQFTANDMHIHFEEFGRWDSYEIAVEGRHVWNLMFESKIEADSPIDDILHAVAAQASHGAFASVAAALGVNARALELAVSDWYESQDNLPAKVGASRLLELIAEAGGEEGGEIDHGGHKKTASRAD